MSRFSGKTAIPVMVVGAALIGGPAIYDAMNRDVTYCTDNRNVIVPDDRCDNRNSTYGYGRGYTLHRGRYPSNVAVGQPLPRPTSGTPKQADASNNQSRSKAGISSSGQVVSGKSGGFGSKGGSSGSSSSGGS